MIRLAWIAACLALLGCQAAGSNSFTSTRQIAGLVETADGGLWAGTSGGLLYRSPQGNWTKLMFPTDLPDNEIIYLEKSNNAVFAYSPQYKIELAEGMVKSVSRVDEVLSPAISASWKGNIYRPEGVSLSVETDGKRLQIPLPAGRGSHVSALLAMPNYLLVALYGDGLWSYNSKSWKRLETNVPEQARQITCLAKLGNDLFVGSNHGVWRFDGLSWSPEAVLAEPADHNCQYIFRYKGLLLFSTLDQGLVTLADEQWNQITAPTISSNAPRQMVEFQGMLYVRHGSGKIDSFDGKKWNLNLFSGLPRKQVSCIAADQTRLYLGQWGGWSEFDGKQFAHFLNLPQLQGYQTTALLPDSQKLWIGTQGLGLLEYIRETGKVKVHDERAGMPDDWIKLIWPNPLLVGTFVGGLASYDGSVWRDYPELRQIEVTSAASDGTGVYIGTRTGLYYLSGTKLTPVLVENRALTEVQALEYSNNTLQIGTRTGIYSQEFQVPAPSP